MRVLVALGGNALLKPDEPVGVETQRRNAEVAARVIEEIAADHEVVVTHGNGPQIGLLARQSALAQSTGDARSTEPAPLDALGAETEGLIGYLLSQALRNAAPDREIVSLLTQVEVDADDPGFGEPTKPIGPVLDADEARERRGHADWTYAPDRGGLRRVVASPEPRRVLELPTIERLVEAGVIVICAGGGGIPVVRDHAGRLRGAEAVIDKDLCSALLAESLRCDRLLLLTDVEGIHPDWPERTRPIRSITPGDLRRIPLDPGSMGPKAEAACRFVEGSGGHATIARLENGAAALRGKAGTRIAPEPDRGAAG
ncbi:MAG: carbamate kinase [Deltaproteobacteria bacterium]|jgi:carbamate kinase|nr:carbamate kinase [Deltaproteobacteria bacterium]MBW2500342.1 carbamate kinase [Deltaproteobacteria bacterium]